MKPIFETHQSQIFMTLGKTEIKAIAIVQAMVNKNKEVSHGT